MCGLVGFLTASSPGSKESNKRHLVHMSKMLSHRGPDDVGIWMDAQEQVYLAHRRLAILDTSAAGHQPMQSNTGQYVISFNGEIYNHLELRKKLKYAGWKGRSDTETLLVAFEEWGIEATLKSTIGMFAIALWDRKIRQLTLARDRIGEKPLYYGW